LGILSIVTIKASSMENVPMPTSDCCSMKEKRAPRVTSTTVTRKVNQRTCRAR
jgi:hypothetical protein